MRNTAGKSFVVIFFMILTTSVCQSQEVGSREAIRSQMIEFVRYVGLEKSSTPTDLDRMVGLWSKAAQPGISLAERETAFRDLNILYAKMHGADFSNMPQALSGVARRSAAAFESGGRMDLRLPEPRGPISGDYIHVAKLGHVSRDHIQPQLFTTKALERPIRKTMRSRCKRCVLPLPLSNR